MTKQLIILSALLAALSGCKRESGDMTSEPAYPVARQKSTNRTDRGTNQAETATNRTEQVKTNNPAKP